MALDNRFGDSQPQPGPTSLFCTEEWFEHPEPDCGGDSLSVIGKKDMRLDVSAAGTNLQGAIMGQRLHGVGDQI